MNKIIVSRDYTWMPRMEEVLGSEDPDTKARLEMQSGRKETTDWMGLSWVSCKLAAGAQILGQGTENEAIEFSLRWFHSGNEVMEWNGE